MRKSVRDSNWAIRPYRWHKHGDCWEWVRDLPVETKCEECGETFTAEAVTAIFGTLLVIQANK